MLGRRSRLHTPTPPGYHGGGDRALLRAPAPGVESAAQICPVLLFRGIRLSDSSEAMASLDRSSLDSEARHRGAAFTGCTCDSEQNIYVPCPTNVYLLALMMLPVVRLSLWS